MASQAKRLSDRDTRALKMPARRPAQDAPEVVADRDKRRRIFARHYGWMMPPRGE